MGKTGRTNKPGAGRPRLDLDVKKIERLASIQCTMEEIAAVMECSVDTLENNFSDIIKKGKSKGRASVRRQQYKLLEAGNATMGVWLGKNLLGQKDVVENTIIDGDKALTDQQLRDKIERMLNERKKK